LSYIERITNIFFYLNKLGAYKWGLTIICLILFIIFLYIVFFRTSKNFNKLQSWLNLFSIILSILIIGNIFYNSKGQKCDNKNLTVINKSSCTDYPNIYHIILDAYTNKDALEEVYNYDNREFYNYLSGKGFIVFEKSFSTYPSTLFSVTSMLNLGNLFLNDHTVFRGDNKLKESQLEIRLNENHVWDKFTQNGYNIYLWSNGALIDYRSKYIKKILNSDTLNYFIFPTTCLAQTPIKHSLNNLFLSKIYQLHIRGIQASLNGLRTAKAKYGETNNIFYAHILSPHAPYVFDENGECSQEQSFEGFLIVKKLNILKDESQKAKNKYTNQIKAISKKISTVIDSILSEYENSKYKPIIILHGDHGWPLYSENSKTIRSTIEKKVLTPNIKAYFGNLFALYIPSSWHGEGKNVTFINLYRFILNKLFLEKYEYLTEKHFLNGNEIDHDLLLSN
jgi:hypothetical protein